MSHIEKLSFAEFVLLLINFKFSNNFDRMFLSCNNILI